MMREDPSDPSVLYLLPVRPVGADPAQVESLIGSIREFWADAVNDLLPKLSAHAVGSQSWMVAIVNAECQAARERGRFRGLPPDDFHVAVRILWRIYVAAMVSGATSDASAALAAGMLSASIADQEHMPQIYLQHQWGDDGPISYLCLRPDARTLGTFEAADVFFAAHPDPGTAEAIARWLTSVCPEGPSCFDIPYYSSAITALIKAQMGK